MHTSEPETEKKVNPKHYYHEIEIKLAKRIVDQH